MMRMHRAWVKEPRAEGDVGDTQSSSSTHHTIYEKPEAYSALRAPQALSWIYLDRMSYPVKRSLPSLARHDADQPVC